MPPEMMLDPHNHDPRPTRHVIINHATDDCIELRIGSAETPFGRCVIADTHHGICHLSFCDLADIDATVTSILRDWPHARQTSDDAHAQQLSNDIFSNKPNPLPTKLLVRGSAFQLRVWRMLTGIPIGTTVSYGQLAAALGQANAARAVGRAVASNQIAYLIPCHRVIRGDRQLGGFRWGIARKRALLASEGITY